MDDDEKKESGKLKKTHFKKLHEKIQNKYNRMKLRLEKSKSVGSLSSLSDNFDFKEAVSSTPINKRKFEKTHENGDHHRVENNKVHSYNEEHLNIQVANLEIIMFETATVEEIPTPNTSLTDETENLVFPSASNSNLSENEENNENNFEESSLTTIATTAQKITLRYKIRSRIAAAREKRQRRRLQNITSDRLSLPVKNKDDLMINNNEMYLTPATGLRPKKDYKKVRKVASVTVALIHSTGTSIEEQSPSTTTDTEDKRLFFCRIRLGPEKRKTKITKATGAIIKWQQMFSLDLFNITKLEIDMFERDIFFGRVALDVLDYESEKTHILELEFKGGVASDIKLFMLLTISGTDTNTYINIEDYQRLQKNLNATFKKFSRYSLSGSWEEIGFLSVLVYGIKGLPLGAEYYCVLELGNDRLETPVDYHNSNQHQWMKLFNFVVTDVTKILMITVCDNKKNEDVAKLAIALLNIKTRERKWYPLKDPSLKEPAKGDKPRILLEIRFSYNLVKASAKIIRPQDKYYLLKSDKFERQLLSRNWTRLKAVWLWAFNILMVCRKVFAWDSPYKNFVALLIWIFICLNFRPWMIPLFMLTPFYWFKDEGYLIQWQPQVDGEKKEESQSKSLRKRIVELQDLVKTVQNGIGDIASYGEKIKNLFNFTVPFLSIFVIVILIVITIIMYFIPAKYIMIGWALRKYIKHIAHPSKRKHNKIVAIISRVPDDETLFDCSEIQVELSDEEGFDIETPTTIHRGIIDRAKQIVAKSRFSRGSLEGS